MARCWYRSIRIRYARRSTPAEPAGPSRSPSRSFTLFLMQNTGGIATGGMTSRFPVRSLDSGPAAGAILAAHVGMLTGDPDLIAFDMGGTTAKAALIENAVRFAPISSRWT